MIVTKLTEKGILHYSNSGFAIKQNETGLLYDSADDIAPCRYTYTETDVPITDDPEADTGDYQSALNRLGVSTDD